MGQRCPEPGREQMDCSEYTCSFWLIMQSIFFFKLAFVLFSSFAHTNSPASNPQKGNICEQFVSQNTRGEKFNRF